jgi:tyrosine-protein kinase Etk/Wzc
MEQETEHVGEKGFNLFDLVILCLKRFRLIMSITVGIAVLTALIVLSMPRIYQSTARIVAARVESPTAALLGRLGGAGAGGFDFMTGGVAGGSVDFYTGALKSPTIADAIIDRFNLMDVYRARQRESARKRLLASIKCEGERRSGIVSISVTDKDPQRAADLANALVEELEKRCNQIAVSSASRKRLFFEGQLKQAHMSLATAEAEMSTFQEDTGAIRIDEQARAVLDGIAKLQARVMAKEIELKVMKTYATPYNRDVRKIEEELSGLQEQLKKLDAKDNKNPSGIISTGQLPTVSAEYVRKLREFKYQEALYEILIKQYEAARMAEAQDATLINVLDAAVVPEIAIGPKRKQIVLLVTAVAFFFAVLGVLATDGVRKKLNSPGYREGMEKIKENVPAGLGLFSRNGIVKRILGRRRLT